MTLRHDHTAFRCFLKDRQQCENFIINALGYKRQEDFTVYFDDENKEDSKMIAVCTAYEPSNRLVSTTALPWTWTLPWGTAGNQDYVLAPEIFLSSPKEDAPGNIIYDWCKAHGNMLHHLAFNVSEGQLEAEQKRWLDNGWCESFSTDKPITCDNGLKQLFTPPSQLFGIVFELLERKDRGFCAGNLKEIFLSSARADTNMS